jgi:hypothetical protein
MKVKTINLKINSLRVLALMLLLASHSLFSQQFKTLVGQVKHDSLSVSGIHIINQTKGTATITDVEGAFEMVVSPGDILFFSAIQFKPKALPIATTLFEAAALTVYLEPFVNELDEVVVRPYDLSGDLSRDLQNTAIQNPVNFYSLGIPGFGGKREEKIVSGKSLLLNTLLLPISGGINLEAAYKHFSGYYKSLKKKRQLDKQFEITYQIIQFYGVQFLMDNYALSEENVYEFITGAQENFPIDGAFRKKNHTQLLSFLETYASEFKPPGNTKS